MGQQLVILLCLFIISLSVILLFIIYFLLNMFIKNQEYVLSKFNNRFIKLYIKYQIVLAKIATIHIPITIVIGLLVLIHGLHFLITHPIPLENLGMDLHSFISSKK
uniref:Uncharacterized protein n=1 Tax=Hypsizygus marmoreus TaxID=39966 RepID=A0A4P8D2T5_HYPMA|nr:hypothetical protein [Hypsizygus marmoreus]